MNWSDSGGCVDECRLPTRSGDPVDVRTLDVMWWRRVQREQRLPWSLGDSAQVDLVNNDCSAALVGTLLTRFHGVWINDPIRAFYSENKLLQLHTADAAGFHVPDTLVSQDPDCIRRFCGGRDGTVVKAVMGTRKAGLLTRMVTERHLASNNAMRVAPAIYQEYIPGARHVRVQCFGDDVIAVLITTEDLDWRARLDSDFQPWSLPERVRAGVTKVLETLGLRMGIVDLKLTDQGEYVWLEVNQQGQFLFLEGLTDLPLTSAFCEFLMQEAQRARNASFSADTP
jgi:glutathione synthase/RimK-type ligase-like ATP-grasp enzyme